MNTFLVVIYCSNFFFAKASNTNRHRNRKSIIKLRRKIKHFSMCNKQNWNTFLPPVEIWNRIEYGRQFYIHKPFLEKATKIWMCQNWKWKFHKRPAIYESRSGDKKRAKQVLNSNSRDDGDRLFSFPLAAMTTCFFSQCEIKILFQISLVTKLLFCKWKCNTEVLLN